MLISMEDVPESSEDLEEFYIEPPQKKKHPLRSLSQHKKQAQQAWLALMHLGLSKEQRKKVLDVMAASIAPWFTQPELLMDFLTDCYNSGGSISLLALSGVFYLIQERNLDYPEFYTKLYSLLDADILHSKYRSRFFRLLDTFLGSSHLPAVLVASFIKRLARLALNAPPSAIVVIVPWFYNLFKKHPLTTFMMHRVPRTKEEKDLLESEGLEDPFLPDERDPMETRAIDSCLWEIVQLQSHYHPNVATIAKIISEQFTKQAYSLEDFLDHSYGSVSAQLQYQPWIPLTLSQLIEAEMTKEVKKPPVVEYMIPKRIFTKAGPAPEENDSLLASLWDFGSS
jgi:U3 small nucleolar RNA-associated protein 19